MATSPDISNELKEVGISLILKAGQGNPYTIPTGYFDQLPASVLTHIQGNGRKGIEAELKDIAPLLNRISKKGPYEVPSDYFSDPIQVSHISRPGKSRPATLRNLYRFAAAAAVTGLILIALFNDTPQNKPADQAVRIPKTITDTELHAFLDNEVSTDLELIDWPIAASDENTENARELFEEVSLQELEQFSRQFDVNTQNTIN